MAKASSTLPALEVYLFTLPCKVKSENVSTGRLCVPGFGAGFVFALAPSKLQKNNRNLGKGQFHFLHQTLVLMQENGT